MTREEIKAKLQQAKTNKVLPEKMRALSIAKYEKMLADLPEDKANKDITTLKELEKKDPKMYEWYLDLKRDTGMPFADFKEQYLSTKTESKKDDKKVVKKPTSKGGKVKVKILGQEVTIGTKEHKKLVAQKKHFDDLEKSETESKIKQGDYVKFKDVMDIKVYHVNGISGNDATLQEVGKSGNNVISANVSDLKIVQKDTKNYDKKEPDYDCDKLIADVKAKREKAKKSAEKSAKKPEVTKAKERIEKTYEAIETKVEKGEFTKTQLQKLIEETREYLKRLEKAIKSL